jgi:ribosomal protein S5
LSTVNRLLKINLLNFDLKFRSFLVENFKVFKILFKLNNFGIMEFTTRLLSVRLVKNMTKNGKIPKFSVCVAVGNGKGGMGVGSSKDSHMIDAVAKARKIAFKQMNHYSLFENRTIFHDDKIKFKSTIVSMRPLPPGIYFITLETGRRCHPSIAEICRCVGIEDISAKVIGSSNALNVSRAFINLLENQKSPLQISKEFGIKLINLNQKLNLHSNFV